MDEVVAPSLGHLILQGFVLSYLVLGAGAAIIGLLRDLLHGDPHRAEPRSGLEEALRWCRLFLWRPAWAAFSWPWLAHHWWVHHNDPNEPDKDDNRLD